MVDQKDDHLKEQVSGAENESEQTSVNTNADTQESENITQEETQDDDVHKEIDESNAEDAEDEGHRDRHELPEMDYHAMSMEKLTEIFQKLLRNEKIQAIKHHVDQIKSEFDLKFSELYEQKKEDFLHEGGNEIDFSFTTQTKRQFNELYQEYREKRNQYYQNLEQRLKENLQRRLDIIEELKGLINVEENINETYRHFKELQEQWRNTGPIPRIHYNDVWRTYHHHVEIFYDFLDLNRDLRDLDFRHNLEEKEKIIARAEELAAIPDVNKAFRELQVLHKIWKEDLGPVDREHRDSIWDRFSNATRVIHQRRQEYLKNQDSIHEANLVVKRELIAKISDMADKPASSHNQWQKQIKEIETLREAFFNAGKVPYKLNEQTWADFKQAVRRFNRNKNNFYKNLKKEQQENLEKKQELVAIATSLKDSDDWDAATATMKRIQAEWKNIGHVPRKQSDKVWEEFKAACNHYFDRLHSRKNKENSEETEAFQAKSELLNKFREFQLSGNTEDDLETVKEFIASWNAIGRVPFSKKNIEGKFHKIADALFRKIGVSKEQAELIRYDTKIQELAEGNDQALKSERIFIRRKIDDLKGEIRQLENNLQFFNADETNPIVREVQKNIDKHKEDLEIWQAKLRELKSLEDKG